jgi:hypothetical protein
MPVITQPEVRPKFVEAEAQPDNSSKSASNASDKRQTKRRFIITELVDTEKTYYNELKRCYSSFMDENLIAFDQVRIKSLLRSSEHL